MKNIKLYCEKINKEAEHTSREVGKVYECFGYSFDKNLGIIFNPISKKLEIWELSGMKEIREIGDNNEIK